MTDPRQLLAAHEQEIARLAATAAQAREAIAKLVVKASSPDGAVTVGVTAVGALAGIKFGEGAGKLSRSAMSATVMATVKRAQADAARRVADLMKPVIGDDSDAMAMLRSQLPALAEDPDA